MKRFTVEGSPSWVMLNAVWLQLGWWACVMGGNTPWLLGLVALGLLVHVLLCAQPLEELKVMLGVAAVGWTLDAALGALGVFEFAQGPLPLWLALLWLVFASCLRHCLAWITKPASKAALFGFFGGPLAYCAGAPLAGVGLPLGTIVTGLLLAPIWALVMWLALSWANRPRVSA